MDNTAKQRGQAGTAASPATYLPVNNPQLTSIEKKHAQPLQKQNTQTTYTNGGTNYQPRN